MLANQDSLAEFAEQPVGKSGQPRHAVRMLDEHHELVPTHAGDKPAGLADDAVKASAYGDQ